MKNLIALLLLLLSVVCSLALDPPSDPIADFVAGKEPPEEISRILYEAQVHDPQALEKLRYAPLGYTLRGLLSISSTGTPVKTDDDKERKRIAKDILLTHPRMEDFLTETLKLRNEELKQGNAIMGQKQKGDYFLDYPTLLGYAHTLPGNQAFRVVGNFMMDAPYHPPADAGDYRIVSPAAEAYGFLAILIHKRLPDERVPQNYQEGVEWWKKNATRFAMTPEEKAAKEAAMAKMQAAANPAATTPAPTATPVPAVAAATVQEVHRVPWWAAGAAVAAALMIVGFLALRRQKV